MTLISYYWLLIFHQNSPRHCFLSHSVFLPADLQHEKTIPRPTLSPTEEAFHQTDFSEHKCLWNFYLFFHLFFISESVAAPLPPPFLCGGKGGLMSPSLRGETTERKWLIYKQISFHNGKLNIFRFLRTLYHFLRLPFSDHHFPDVTVDDSQKQNFSIELIFIFSRAREKFRNRLSSTVTQSNWLCQIILISNL